MCQFTVQAFRDCGHIYAIDLLSHCPTFQWSSPCAPNQKNTYVDLSKPCEGRSMCLLCYEASVADIVSTYELMDFAITTNIPPDTSSLERILPRMELRKRFIDDLRAFDAEVSSDGEAFERMLSEKLERRFRPSWKMVWAMGQEKCGQGGLKNGTNVWSNETGLEESESD